MVRQETRRAIRRAFQSFRTIEGEILTLLKVLDLKMIEIYGWTHWLWSERQVKRRSQLKLRTGHRLNTLGRERHEIKSLRTIVEAPEGRTQPAVSRAAVCAPREVVWEPGSISCGRAADVPATAAEPLVAVRPRPALAAAAVRIGERSLPRLEPRRPPASAKHYARQMQRHQRGARASRHPPVDAGR